MNPKSKNLDSQAAEYLQASGGSSAAKSVKAQIYAAGKADTAAAPVARRNEDAGAVAGSPTVNAGRTASLDAPINNMGENWHSDIAESEEVVLTDSGKIKQVMIRRPANEQSCVVDWINFTVLEDTWFKSAREILISDDQIMVEASRHLQKIFGFGITSKRETGMNFYRSSWVLGDDMGFVCFGGQRQTMLITLTGQGCLNALQGWEKRLYDFLATTAIRPSISRIDLAHDDLDGSYLSVDWALKRWHEGGYSFAKGGTPPNAECVGNWLRPRGKGRTFTIGTRTSGKFCRFYEKGKKEGDKTSLWCRCEVEFKSSDRIIPLNVLINPTEYFAGAYPCFAEFVQLETPKRLELKEKSAEINVADSIEVTKKQFGKYLRVFRELYGDKETLDLVCNPNKDAWPKRLKTLTSSAHTGPKPIHELEPAEVLDFMHFQNRPSNGLNSANGFPQARH